MAFPVETSRPSLQSPAMFGLERAIDMLEIGDINNLIDALHYPYQYWTYDWDKTVTQSRVLRNEFNIFDPQQYYEQDIQTLYNIDLLALKAILGHPQHICTGKDWNFWPVTHYIHERIEHIAEKLHMNNRAPDGVLLSLLHPDQRIFFAASSGNGGLSLDIIRNELLVLKPIPLRTWLAMARNANLLRYSTTQSRLDTIAKRVTGYEPYREGEDPFFYQASPYKTMVEHRKDTSPITKDSFHREIAPFWTKNEQEHLKKLQKSIQDHVVFVPGIDTKANYVLDMERIIHDPQLHDAWYQTTGINIVDFASFMFAFRVLSSTWGATVNFSEAHDTIFIDVTGPEVDKGLSQRLIKKHFQFRLTEDMQDKPSPKYLSFSMADNNDPDMGNDRQLLYRTRGVVVGNPSIRHPRIASNYPVYLDDIYGQHTDPMTQAYFYLYDSTIASCPPEIVSQINNLLQELQMEHLKNASS